MNLKNKRKNLCIIHSFKVNICQNISLYLKLIFINSFVFEKYHNNLQTVSLHLGLFQKPVILPSHSRTAPQAVALQLFYTYKGPTAVHIFLHQCLYLCVKTKHETWILRSLLVSKRVHLLRPCAGRTLPRKVTPCTKQAAVHCSILLHRKTEHRLCEGWFTTSELSTNV